ncbi:ABC transporter ATP-binding protein [Dactylosporangium aurantiacum]|uniref:ABC transporter ATP-binding protein n=1 Tax=Dactylosporangium aurantiacum TaxID=35754 RepID=A0A9Q9IJ11_9ACTN|nr:ABC transporter ATP-binding protein [Dactylosporangium aurantiacum]MDG6100905.1 ABC transporter ATP-binding protein [Dactylosporangium aurantiacum]UWZ55040.1 ABC transporter ATP-binding protein [Dactylosporangium aurantiacum]
MSGRVARTVLGLAVRAAPWSLAGVLLTAVLGAGSAVTAAWLTKTVIDRLTAGGAVLWPAVALALVGVAATVLPQVDQLLRAELAREVGLLSQDRLYRAVNGYAGLAPFEDPAHLDRLRLAQQCGQDTPVQLVGSVLSLCRAAVTVTGFVVSLAVISPWLTAVVVLGAAPALLAELRIARVQAAVAVRVTPLERREAFFSNLLGSIQAAKEVRLFGIGDHLRALMRADRRAINAIERRAQLRAALLQGGPALLSAAVCALGLVWAVQATARGVLSVGDISMFVAGVAAVQAGVASIAQSVAVAHRHLLLFQHYVTVVDTRPDLPQLEPVRSVPPLRHGIELRDVWFRYSERHPWALRGVDLTIPCGRSVALVGLNGAGKSTLVKLLCRFYDPTRGTILWDGVDLRHLPVAELRARVSAIFQDFMSYDLSAAQNIALDGVPLERIRAAARLAGIDDTLAGLPRGYDTMLTRSFFQEPETADDGVILSGGQWQRVALARAFLRDTPDLLIMDEPSSGLDPAAEYEIQQTTRRHLGRRTSLLISHRLNTIRDADEIAVLADGVIAERGTHASLLAAGGRYASLFAKQSAGYVGVG